MQRDATQESAKPAVPKRLIRAAAQFTKLVARGEVTDFVIVAVESGGGTTTMAAMRAVRQNDLIAEMTRALHSLVTGEFEEASDAEDSSDNPFGDLP